MSAKLSFSPFRRTPVVLQSESAECGLACIAMVLGYHGFACDLTTLRTRFSSSLRGATLADITRIAGDLQLASRALRLEPHSLRRLRTPCLLHWGMDHFVVLEDARAKRIKIIDPAIGRRTVGSDEVSSSFTGIALELTPTSAFAPAKAESPLRLTAFFRRVAGLPQALLRLLAFSIAIQLLALLMPLLTQLILDEVLTSADLQLLNVLAVGFALVVLLNVALSLARAMSILHLGAHLQFGWAANLFHHLIRLPLSYYEKRSVADILSRFRSLGAVQGLVSNTMIDTVIDGLMASTTLVVMFVYAPTLTFIPIFSVIVYLIVRFAIYAPQREAAQEALVQSAKENSHFLESLRGIIAIKGFGAEGARALSWQNRMADSIRSNVRSTAYSVTQPLIGQALFGLENIVVIWFAAGLVIEGHFSVGMMIAFLAYKAQFTSRANALVDKLLEFRLVSVHLERLADIALADREVALDTLPNVASIQGRIELRDVHFRHADTDPYVLRGVTLIVEPGQCIAIVAPSGAGKTTLLKVMMGLLRPTTGKVLADGWDIHSSLACYRKHVAAVMQEDALFSGTLIDNIAFFSASIDTERVEACAKMAAIHDDIVSMPMGYLTLVGDMGAAMSGGQRQRVLLARALYSQPQILFLDEATSHLDPQTEQRIHDSLAKLKITRVIVSHRRETTQIADSVVELQQLNGRGLEREIADGPLQTAA
ncbi:peptidase domain-containing ABC transporter [Sinimarinibacterium flocculans]|uniref:peptidase domain-containing ABC transporter n=1 Tax=Sinimarinibacterium flocculans TaxID=985250 RepID=UPI0035170250